MVELYYVHTYRPDTVVLDRKVYTSRDRACKAAAALWRFHNGLPGDAAVAVTARNPEGGSFYQLIGTNGQTRALVQQIVEGDDLE